MRAAVLHAPGDIRVETVADPELLPGHAMVRVEACGVCGSDLPRMLTKGAYRLPLICGHEFSGRVVALGEGVEDVAEGDVVTVPPLIPCFRCDQCQRGAFSRCRDYGYFGSRDDGAYAEYVAVPRRNLVKVPRGLDPTAAAMTDPAAIALHAIWKARFQAGMRAAVIGCGPIGLFAIQWFRIMGASEILAIDLDPNKLAMGEEAGATASLPADRATDGFGGYDIVFEGAGHPVAENNAVRLVAPGGSAVFIGIPQGGVPLDARTFDHFLRNEVSLHGAWNSFSAPFPGDEWFTSLAKFASGELKWRFMITHDLDIAELPRIFEVFRDRKETTAKVIFRS